MTVTQEKEEGFHTEFMTGRKSRGTEYTDIEIVREDLRSTPFCLVVR
jgi:hypothetical protein